MTDGKVIILEPRRLLIFLLWDQSEDKKSAGNYKAIDIQKINCRSQEGVQLLHNKKSLIKWLLVKLMLKGQANEQVKFFYRDVFSSSKQQTLYSAV